MRPRSINRALIAAGSPASIGRLYAVMRDVAPQGICKANQREIRAATGMAFKTIIKMRDELVRVGLIERFDHYRGKRDWYRIISITKRECEIEKHRRDAKINENREQLRKAANRELSLF
jgi:hypothetical protein